MNRSDVIKLLSAVVLCLGPALLARVQAGYTSRVGASAETSTGAAVQPGARTGPEASESGAQHAGEPATKGAAELSAGRRQKGEGHLAAAEADFQKSVAAAPRGSRVYKEALEELTYQLPLMRVQRYVLAGDRLKAGELLQELLQEHKGDKKKSRHIVQLIARLRKGRLIKGGVYSEPGSGHSAIETVEATLRRFYAQNGRYPRGYRELNELLPPDRYPLNKYDIVRYVEQGHAYGLTLRSKTDPDNLLSIQDTGLVQ